MQMLQTDHHFTCIQAGSPDRQMKQVICEQCNKEIRFLIHVPNICKHCNRYVGFPEHLFASLSDRLSYYQGITS